MKKLLILALLILFNNTPLYANDCIDELVGANFQPRTGVTLQNDNAIFDDNRPLSIPLTVDLAERLYIGSEFELDAPIGMVTIYKNGRILYDGKDITSTIESNCTHGTRTSITEE